MVAPTEEVEDWVTNVDDVTAQIKGIIDGTITDFEEIDRKMEIKERVKRIREEEKQERKERFFKNGIEGKGEGTKYKWWCRRCFVEYLIDLPDNACTRCKQSDMMLTQEQRREELLGKLEDFKKEKARHQFRKDKWLRWKKSQAMLKRSKYINYKAWTYWEPDTDTEDEGEPICPRDNPDFLAMEADMKQRRKKNFERSQTARKCRERGNECMKSGDFLAALENYEEGLEYRRDDKFLWTNKALAELKTFRWHDAIASCNKVIEYSEIFEEGFQKSADANFKAFTRRAVALRALHRWEDALSDLEDALKLFPKDKEAKDLYEKTKVALAETKVACQMEKKDKDGPREDLQSCDTTEAPESAPETDPCAEAPGARHEKDPVRVQILESDDDDEDEEQDIGGMHVGSAASLAGLSAREFNELLQKLKQNPDERMRFCSRGKSNLGNDGVKRDGRKLELKVEEVVTPSGLDGVIRDVERCCVLWKKHQGKAVALHPDAQQIDIDEEPEDKPNEIFLRTATPRVLKVLLVLARHSDHHCELSAAAIRFVWPLLSSTAWRYTVLELLMEWSQRSVSARSMAEFASRYPKPHLSMLVEVATQDTKENVLPPGFDERMKSSAERMERGELDTQAALGAVLQGLSSASLAELSISTLGNICMAGKLLPLFKEQLASYADELVDALKGRLRAADWRLCGKSAGALCNIVHLGDRFATKVHEVCLHPLVSALREEKDSPVKLFEQLQLAGAADASFRKSTGRLLAALVNLVVVRPVAAHSMLELGALDVLVPLIDPDAGDTAGVADDATPAEITSRATLIVGRLVGAAPHQLTQEMEADLLSRLQRLFDREGDFSTVRAAALREGVAAADSFESLELATRLLTTILVKTPGALTRLIDASAPSGANVEELPDDYDVSKGSPTPAPAASWGIAELLRCLTKLVKALQPADYLGPDHESTALSRMRGNIALAVNKIAQAHAEDDAPPVASRLDLSPLVPALLDTLRKERGNVQFNVGVCVTTLARNSRYKQIVRDLNGFETLHQVQLPKVEKQKEREMKIHRIRGPVRDDLD